MADSARQSADYSEKVRESWVWFLLLGILLVAGGLVLVAAPLASSIAITLLIALVLVGGGAVQIYHAFRCQGWTGFLWDLITGLIALIGGVVIYTQPLAGTLALTLVVAAVFLAQGAGQLVFAFRLRPHDGWGWIAAAGVVSLAAGVLIWFEFPSSAAWALGLVAGLSVAFNGWSYITIALAARPVA
ncbi:HdeD family acid-resistance protein [Polymorphum gilvum]|uniref:HdeD protein n=1 Tax=Polymorphum gilvum (strain LMG 25793 / CGMCC 1.9160 / SL003B-26A1) TaxID=991905 RepID=F2J469_POLGS|nr:HdeD family acid-resistance protein [Polymorphum gilvum]ADZ69995.1 hypothetical protein SL003B_1567 [Polymorphum gilvum SL003B-26A1]